MALVSLLAERTWGFLGRRSSGHVLGCVPGGRPAVASRLRDAISRAIEPLEGRLLFAAYNITDLGTLGGATSEGLSVNASGQAAVTADLTPDGGGISSIRAARFSGGSLTDIGTFGGPDSIAAEINAAGHVAGSASDANGQYRGFLWDGASKTNIGTLGGSFSVAEGLNASDVVVGSSQVGNDTGPEHAFVWQNGTMTDLGSFDTLGADYSKAYAINTSGQIVGESATDTGEVHAFIRSSGAITDIGVVSGDSYSTARGINDAGNVVGRSGKVSGNVTTDRAFLYNGSSMVSLGALSGDNFSQANAINSTGTVVGFSADDVDLNDERAVVYTGGTMQDLNGLIDGASGWTLVEARGINDSGQIVGVGMLNGSQRAFLLTPTGGGGGGDTTSPTAITATPSPTLNATTFTVTITYSDNVAVAASSIDVNDIQVARDGGASLTVQSVAKSPNANAGTITAVYTVAAPGGTWESSDDGSYTVTLRSSQVTDSSGNFVAGATTPFTTNFGQFSGPTAVIAPPTTVTTAGGTTSTFTVTYTDSNNVSASTIGVDDVTISGGGVASLVVTGVSVSPTSDGSPLVATYAFTPPGDAWDASDNGTYTVSLNSSQVFDTQGNPATATSENFDVNIPVEVPTLDPTFNSANPVGAGFVAEATVADLDGKLYVAGHSGDLSAGSSVGVIRRYNADGSLDSTFGVNGQATTAVGLNDAFYNIALDPSGKTVVVSGARGGDFLASRYTTRGKLDSKFGSRGVAVSDLGSTSEVAYGLAVAADSSVFIGGGSGDSLAVLKLNKKGRLDTTFGLAGSTVVPGGGPSVVSALAIQNNGFILVAGDLNGSAFVSRLASDGVIDPGFNGGSAIAIPSLAVRTDLGGPDHTVGLALQTDGNILVANRTSSGNFGVVRVDTNGAFDSTFSGDGVATFDLGGDDDADKVLVQGTGQIVLIGTTDAGGVQTAVVVLDSSGSLLSSFDGDGKFAVATAISDPATALVTGGQTIHAAGVIQPNGRIVTVTSSTSPTSGSGIRRLNAPGAGLVGQFGIVNGKKKSLAFTDADGTKVTLSLNSGIASVYYDGTSVNLTVNGTTNRSSLSVKTKGGDGRLRIGNVLTDAALGTFSAKTTDVFGSFFVNGELKKLDMGTLGGSIGVNGNIGSATFRGDLAGAEVLAGANFGADGVIGGTDNTYAAAAISKFSVAGTVAASVIGAGFDPVDGDFTNGGIVVGGAASVIKSVSVKRVVDGASRFYAGAFGKIKAPGKVDPLTDDRFEVL